MNDEQHQQSDDKMDCFPCTLFTILKKWIPFGKPKPKFDPIGTPLQTPISQKRREKEMYRDFGLEVEDSVRKPIPFQGGAINSAVVHRGKMGEQQLHQKYEICEVLGVGSTSTCHRAVERLSGTQCACKIIDKGHIEKQYCGMLDQFHTEITALQSLRHPNIITLYDVYVTDDKIYIVMELMEGGELFDYVVQKGTLNEEEASRIVRKVTSALVYMHSKNIIHRDLKPENLLLTKKVNSKQGKMNDIEVKIIDFGLSKYMEEPVARSFLGTRGYLAPEMLQRRDYFKPVDTWALGIITFVLVCGCLPFDEDPNMIPSDDMVRSKFRLRFPRWARSLSPSAKDLLSHLLNVIPSERYTAEQALEHPWVRGDTADKKSLLKSPSRIKLAPNANIIPPPHRPPQKVENLTLVIPPFNKRGRQTSV